MKLNLRIDNPVVGPENIEVDHFPFILGRSSACDHQVFHPMVSRRHCQIVSTQEGVRLADLNSSNGTYVNGRRVQETVDLTEGDEVHLACLAFRVHYEDN